MLALIVVESMFGNTREVADAIADGVRSAAGEVVVVDVTRAPSAVPEGWSCSSSGARPMRSR